MMENQGIVYIAIGQSHLELAIASAQSVIDTASEPQSITILCDLDYVDANSKISFVNIAQYAGAHWQDKSNLVAYLKTKLYRLTPYEKTLYLDNDIRAVKDLSSIWDYVEDGIGFCKAFNPLIKERSYPVGSEEAYTANVIDDWNQYNSGMFLFTDSSAMFAFFENWNRQWHKFKHHENMALTRLFNHSPVRPIELPSKFNDFYPSKNRDSILIHYIGGYKKYLNE
jgi:lipopolysaccharide biosynthesis glycosyltransferase